ncbi:ABC transporter substrate-binding protein [Salinarchaeum sp. IM2453]|uniref:Bug family tripartite tricarboxylate transporter substrate binding protein n=1 Tax=Salinarchaeum sp. IM2453 TaxID=2862870 RepID=UPI001C83A474|nr:tripartite tricarboxylate transporter substrate-binding protein [Salinarchaeum sp. IM2453]QZA87910.1 ABC transporter substrate-binding protein [Salinarchaeum sp. IM2453]
MRRRDALKGIGAASAVSITGLAGCTDLFGSSKTWMIPWSEGGGTDQYARQLYPLAEEELDESIQIDNRPGAGSLSGIQWMHTQDGDGSVFGTVNTPSWQFGWIQERDERDWDPADFEPIAVTGTFGYVLVVDSDTGIETFSGLQDAYEDGELENFAYQGAGHDTHLLSYILRDDYDVDWENNVPYDGGGEVQENVISGEADAGILTNTSAADPVADGDLNAVVNLTDSDFDAFPDLEKISNHGDDLSYISEFRLTQVAPPDTPREEREQIAEALEYAATHEETEEWEEDTGNKVVFEDIDEAANDLDGVVDTLEDNVDFEEFEQRVEEDE